MHKNWNSDLTFKFIIVNCTLNGPFHWVFKKKNNLEKKIFLI